MPPDGFSFEDALKPVEAEGFSFADALKPAKKPAKDDLPWDVPMTGAQMRQSQEQIRKGEEKIAANEPGPGLEHLLTGPFRIAQRGGQQLLGERPLPTGVEALEEASLGVRPSKFVSATERPPATAPRIEPTVPGGPPAPPPGFTLQEAGITPTPEPPAPGAPKPGSATLEEAGIRPTAEPAPATETETVAVPQADGTVKQVQVKTGEPPPPSEPPAPPTTEAPTAPMNPADLRAGFPELSDEQFEALFQQANREVPRPTSTDPADQTAWMKAVMGTMARLSGAAASATPPAADPWVPVAVAPLDQPEAETPISSETTAAPANQPEVATAPMTPARSEEVPASGLKAGDKVMLGDTEHEVEVVRPWTGDQVAVKLKDDPKLHIGPADAPVQKAPSPEAALAAEPIPAALTNLEGIHNGPWKAVGKNYIGDTVFENANGVRAIMDSNVPYTESTIDHPEKGRVPKNADDRKRQFLIEGEKWADEKPAAKPRKPQSAKSPDQLANSPTQTTTAEKPKPTAAATQKPKPETSPQSGADIPKGRDLRDAAKQADASKAPDASGKSEIKPEQTEKPPAPELPTPKTATVADLPASAPKPKREYDARLTKPEERAANKLAVDALNGDITEKEAVSGLAKMVRDGVIPEGVARVNLGRLTDWNEGEWEAARSAPPTEELNASAQTPTSEADGTSIPAGTGPAAGGVGQPAGGRVRAPRSGSRSGGRSGRDPGLAPSPAGNVPAPESSGDPGEAGVRPQSNLPGGNEPLPDGGNAADGRPGAGGSGVDDAGTGAGPRPVVPELDLSDPGEIQPPTIKGVDVDVSAADVRPNFFISDPEAMVGGGAKQRFNRNRRAIQAFRAIEEEGRQPTETELADMAGFTGWGSFGQDLFQGTFERPMPRKDWDVEGQWLREHLGPEAWRSAQASIRNAHYTDPPTVQAMWNMVRQMGFKGGRVLEPSVGIGNFFGLMPRDLMNKSTLTGIELEPTTGGMAQLLYPRAGVFIKGFQESQTPDNFYDLVIGNWPFDTVGPADRRYNRLNPTLHDYFYLKALDQTRPGGLVVGITSAGTMDKMDRMARMEMAKKGELIASFRLPTGAFEQYAGTKVVTDIIILRKRSEPLTDAAAEPWMQTKEMQTPEGKIRVNQYYHDHPENVLGTFGFGSGTTTFREGMLVHRPADLMERLASLPAKVPANAYTPASRGSEPRFVTNNSLDRKGSVVIGEDGNLYQVAGERMVRLDDVHKPMKAGTARAQQRRLDQIKALVPMRKAYGALIDAERDNADAAPALRDALLDLYTQFAKNYPGKMIDTDGMKVLDKVGDPGWPILAALQRPDGSPAAILSGPVVRGKRITGNPSVSDAYVMVRNESLNLDMDRIAELVRVPVEQVENTLLDSGAIYRTPGGGFEPSDSYLSGNTRRKLREAEDAVQRGEPMEASVEALKKAVPANTPYYEIEAKLGAPWVSNKDYQQFIVENLLDLPEDRWPEVEVRFTGGRWSVTLPSRLTESVEATQTHGHPRYRFDRLLTAAMGNVTPRIMDPADRDGGPYYNAKASEEVATRIQEVREKFQDWAWRDAARTVRLEDAFNQSMNAITKPHYDGSFMDMSGMALTRGDDPFDLRRHQINAIWRGVALGRGLFAHEVGTGKTYTIGGIAIEGRRYGKWNKPLLLAHNANSRAVATEIQQMYPGAKILFLSSEDLTPKTLKQSMYTIRNEDWDLVVMQHSHLDRMALKRETLMGLAREQITAVEDEMNAAAEEDNENLDRVNLNDLADIEKKIRSVTAKNLAKTRLSILSNIEKQAQRASREGAVPFEDLGVDALFVDEAHEFKKPPIATRMNVKGLNTKTSERSIALNFLTQYVKNNNNGNGVFLFTGTPVTNSLNEIFNISRYFMDDVMKREGIADWDTWFNTFADALNDVELVTTGDYESIKRLSSFVNVDELVRVMSQFTDVVQAKDMPEFVDRATETGKTLGAPGLTPEERDFLENGRTENPTGRPYKRVINDVVEIPSDQATILAQLREEAQAFKRASARYRRDNKHIPLVIDTEVGNASLDARLYDTEAVDNPNSKVNRVTKNVLEIYKTPKTAQMIFFDKGYNPSKRNPNFNMIDDLIDKLVKGGIPRNEIAIVAGDLKPEQKQAIAKAMNTGKLRVAIGQSGTLGVGVNAQDNLRAMHHMDAPWRPGDLEQRNGRGHRQGNSWNTVLEYRYITEGIDGRRWQVLTIKDRFIKQFIGAFNDESGKRIGVIEGDAADISEKEDIMGTLSAAAGDPRLMQKEKLKADVTRLERRERTHTYGIADAARRIAMLRQQIVARGRQKADIEQSLNAWNDAQTRMEAAAAEAGSKNRWYEANIDGQELRTSADIQDAFDKQVLLLAQGEGEVKIGTINGLGIAAEWRKGKAEPYYHLTDAKGDTVGETMTGLTVQRIIGQLTKQKNYLDNVEAWNRIDLEDIPKLEKAAQQPFTQAVPLLKKRQQLANLEDDLQENPVPPPAWLRHGAAIDTPIWVDGKERLVRGHRMKDDYYVVTDEGDVPYMRVTDKNGFNVYVMRPPPPAPPPKDLPAWAPPLIAKTPGAAVIWHRGDLVLVRAEQYGEEVFLGFKKGLTDDQQAWNVYGMRGAFDVKDIDKMRSEAESWRDRERNRKALEQSRQPKAEPQPPPAAPSETPWVGLGGVDPLTRRLLAERESRDAARTRELAAKWIQRQTPGKPN